MFAHAKGTLSYTTSPVHNLQTWVDVAQHLAELGVDSIALKDMAGILTPYAAEELVSTLKTSGRRAASALPLHRGPC